MFESSLQGYFHLTSSRSKRTYESEQNVEASGSWDSLSPSILKKQLPFNTLKAIAVLIIRFIYVKSKVFLYWFSNLGAIFLLISCNSDCTSKYTLLVKEKKLIQYLNKNVCPRKKIKIMPCIISYSELVHASVKFMRIES